MQAATSNVETVVTVELTLNPVSTATDLESLLDISLEMSAPVPELTELLIAELISLLRVLVMRDELDISWVYVLAWLIEFTVLLRVFAPGHPTLYTPPSPVRLVRAVVATNPRETCPEWLPLRIVVNA